MNSKLNWLKELSSFVIPSDISNKSSNCALPYEESAISSCEDISIKNKELSGFSSININAPIIFSHVFSLQPFFEIKCPSNILPYIDILVKEDTLYINLTRKITLKNPIYVTAHGRQIKNITLNNFCRARMSGVFRKNLYAHVNDNCDLEISGFISVFNCIAGSKSNLHTSNLFSLESHLN